MWADIQTSFVWLLCRLSECRWLKQRHRCYLPLICSISLICAISFIFMNSAMALTINLAVHIMSLMLVSNARANYLCSNELNHKIDEFLAIKNAKTGHIGGLLY